MTDKRRTLLWILEDYAITLDNNGTRELIDRIVAEGNSQMLVLRN